MKGNILRYHYLRYLSKVTSGYYTLLALQPLVLLNSFDETALKETKVVVYNDGTMSWVPRARIYTFCFIEYELFPFDI